MPLIGGDKPKPYYQIGGINTYINPILQDGVMIHGVNVVNYPYGAITKRGGYSAFLGTPDSSSVNSLIDFHGINNSGTAFNLLRASGSVIYSSAQGTGAWTVTGNGTISSGGHVDGAILNNTLVLGDGVGSTRHSTDGTSFTNTSLAPLAPYFEQYQGRIYAAGTASFLSYSSAGDGTNWNTSGTSDSATFLIPGSGKLGKIFKCADTLIAPKNTGLMYKWDGFSLIDMSTEYGPSSPYCIGRSEGYRFFLNQYGHFGFDGSKPQILSNTIQRQFYNTAQTGIAGTAFPTIPAGCHIYDYLAAVGTITDDFTQRVIPNAIIKYDFQKNQYLNWSFADNPTVFLSYLDTNNARQLIFGNSTGQCFKMDNTMTDAGAPIVSEMVFLYTFGTPGFEKNWKFWRGFFNPGCEAKVQVACSNVLSYDNLVWRDLGDVSSGVAEFPFLSSDSSRFLFVRIYDSSHSSRFSFYGSEIQAQINVVE